MSHLGIIAAVTAEARTLTQEPIPRGELVYLPGGAMLIVSGMGPARAARTSRALLEGGATALLSWGSAGGLASKVFPGSLILPKTVIASDQSLYHVDTSWHQRLCNRLKGHVDFHTEPLVESSRVVRTPAEKATLFRETGAIGVDMESAAVAAVAQEARVRFMAVRAVADATETTVPESTLNAVDEFGGLNFLKLIQGLAKDPTELLALVRMARNFRAAQRGLAAVLRLTGEDFLIS
ncbi:MAG: purine phosphorylase [Deltaproteobacteria bacterium]